MTHVEKALREMMHDAEQDTRHGEPDFPLWNNVTDEVRKSIVDYQDAFSTYWYDRGIKDACEKALNANAEDNKIREKVSKAALSILDDLEVIGH